MKFKVSVGQHAYLLYFRYIHSTSGLLVATRAALVSGFHIRELRRQIACDVSHAPDRSGIDVSNAHAAVRLPCWKTRPHPIAAHPGTPKHTQARRAAGSKSPGKVGFWSPSMRASFLKRKTAGDENQSIPSTPRLLPYRRNTLQITSSRLAEGGVQELYDRVDTGLRPA